MTMADGYSFLGAGRRLLTAALLLAAAAAATTTGALAQNVVVFVNGEPITAIDLDQRMKLIQVTTQKTPVRQDTLNELIDEKLKVREAKRWGIEVPDSEVDASFARMSSGMRVSAEQLTQNLARQGVNTSTLKARIRADLAWQAIVRGRFRESLQLSDRDVVSRLEEKKLDDTETTGYDYIMRPILFLVPPGSPEPVIEARRKDAEALRGRFRGCEEGIPLARTLRDVAVRDQVVRSSSDLSPDLRKILDAVPIGQITAPEVTRLGVEVFAICAKHETKTDSPGRRQARDAVYAERYEQQSKRYLEQIRRNAMIEHR
jgi:peptidyl-prolyl cis-trans isomerase SurA